MQWVLRLNELTDRGNHRPTSRLSHSILKPSSAFILFPRPTPYM